MRLTTIIVFASAFLFTGCATLTDSLYERETVSAGEVAQTESVLSNGQLIPVSEFQGDLEEHEIIPAGTEIVEDIYEPQQWVENTIGVAENLPIPGAGLAGMLASGVLGISSLWLNGKKKKSDRVAESLVKGIDTFRDILDQTPEGDKIDAELKRCLREHQSSLQVLELVESLLKRFGTPDKTPIKSQ